MRTFRYLIVFLFFAFLSQEAVAGIVPYTRGLLKTSEDLTSQVYKNDPSGAFTTEIVPVWTGLSYVDRSKKGILTLGVNQHFLYLGESTTEVKIKLTTYSTLTSSGVVDTITLKISCFPEDSLSYLDKQSYTFDDVEKFDVMLLDVKYNGVSINYLTENCYIQGDIYVDRVYDFTGNISVPVTITSNHNDDPLDLDCDMVPDEFVIAWDPVEGAEEYQLEWVYINDYDKSMGDLSVDFRLNSTRISTTQTNYHLSLVFDKGYICYRVRAVGRSTTDVSRFIFSPWSTGDGTVGVSGCDYYRQTVPYDVLKNWQYSSTYAEEGKKKEVVSFFDGSLRNRQMVTKINTDKNTIVGETIYDHQGRPAIQVLPVPVPPTLCNTPDSSNSLKFYEKFNRKNSTEAYTKLDFDTSSVVDSCGVILHGMHISSGASKYYSGDNPVTDGIQGYVPDAQNFPFSQVEYTPDNTGRISRQGGVGPDFQLDSGHETKYFYGHPVQEQLDRLFGSEVGYYSHYQKNMVIDPNGQVSVSYLDQEGRVIATSLAGGSPDNMIELESIAEADSITADLLAPDINGISSSNVLGIDGKSKVFNQTILLSSKTKLTIHYDLNITPFVDTCMSLDSSVCFNCIYDLQIEVRDNCGRLVSPQAISNRLTGHFERDTADQVIFKTDCAALNLDTTFVIDSLSVGSYQISKILTVNEEAIQAYVSMYVNDSLNRCKPGYDELLEEQQILIDNDCDEDFSCQECVENLGTLIDYIIAGGTEEEYTLEIAACNGPCTPISYYETMRELLKGDVMPNGQYAQYSNVSGIQTGMYPVSVLNTSNVLPKQPYSDWKFPRYDMESTILNHYYDDDGTTISRIYLDSVVIVANLVTASKPAVATGTNTLNTHVFLDAATNNYYTYPECLANVSDFIAYYGANPYWANSLVYYHPEYPILKFYKQLILPVNSADRFTSEGFDAAMMQVNTWDDAVAAGFIKDPWISEAIDNRLEDFMTDTTHAVWDPAAFYDPSNHIENKVAHYVTLDGIDYSMMEFAATIARCGNLPLGSYPTPNCTLWGNDVGIDPVQNELTRDQEWMAFRSLYFSVKQKMHQDRVLTATLTDPNYYGYNACIGDGGFNRFAHGFLMPYFIYPGPVFTIIGQFINHVQPCNIQSWHYYQNKQIRFGTPVNLSNLSPKQVAYQSYLVTSQCPNASSLQSVLNEAANSGKLDDASFSLNSLNTFSGLLLSINDFDTYAENQNVSWIQTTINSNILEVLWDEPGVGPFATLSLLKDPLDTLGYSWSQIIGFSNLYYSQYNNGNYQFTVKATVQIGGSIFYVPLTGSTTIPIGNCQFEDACEKNDLGRDMQLLFQLAAVSGFIDNTTPENISNHEGFDAALTNLVKHAVSLNSPGDFSWVFDPGVPAFKITNSANSDYLRLGILSFSPSNFTVANMNLIGSVNELVVGSGNTFDLVCNDISGNYLVTIKCDAIRSTSSGMQSIEFGDCGMPTALLCTSEPYKNTEDLEALFTDVLVNQNEPFDLYNSLEMTSSLESQINAPAYHAYGTVSQANDTLKTLTFDVPTDCDITLTHDSIPGLVFSFDSIVAVEGMELKGEFNSFSAYNSFDLTVKVSINDTLHTVVLNGFTCLNLKECVSCTPPPTNCSFAPLYLDSIDSVYIMNGTLQFNPTILNYENYCNLIDTFNVHHGLTPLDTNFVTKLTYYQFFTQIESNNSADYYAFLNSFTENIDSYYLAQNPNVFFSTYSNFNSVQLQYIRYQNAVNLYNAARDGVILDHIATVSLLDFVTTIYSENCDNYINYLLANLSNPSITQTVLEYPNNWTALYYPTDCLSSYLDYAEAYSDHLAAYPSCLPQSYGSGQLLNYSQFQYQGLCSTCGADTVAYFINKMQTTASCSLTLPSIGTCRTPEEQFSYCSRGYNGYYLDAIDMFNNSDWAIANNVTIASEYPTDTAFMEAWLCDCAKPWQGYIIDTYVYAQPTDVLPMPQSITERCIPTYDPPCEDGYQNYLECVALYNQTAMANESKDLITFVISKNVFISENLCNCVDDYCAELNLVSSGLKDFDDMPNLLTFCGCGYPPPCPNDSMNINAEPIVVEFDDPCQEFYESTTANNAYITYQEQTQAMMTDISSRYVQHCLTALEHLSMTYTEVEHHFTLYYYDQAGNLIKTVPPEGVELVDITDPYIKQAILEDRANNTHQVITNHRMATTYLYNSLNQLVAQNMPDQDPMQIFEATLPNGLPRKLNTTAIQMVNANQGYLTGYIDNSSVPMGSRGYLFSTTNGGQNWTRITNTIASDLKRVRMLDDGTGFAVGSSGILILTTDNGASWDMVNTYALNIQEDFVSLELSTTDAYALTRSGKIFKCTPSGILTAHASAPANVLYTINEFKDFSLQNNYSSETGILYIASLNDGTSNYDAILLHAGSSLYTVEKVLTSDIHAVSFYGNSEGVVAGMDGNLSLLSGTSSSDFVQTMQVSGTIGSIDQIYMLNSQIGIARIEENGMKVIRKTTNGGSTWNNMNQDYTNANLALIKRTGPNVMEVLIQGYANNSAYSKTVLLASNGVVNETDQTPLAAQDIELKVVAAYPNGSNTTIYGIGTNDSLYRSNTYMNSASNLVFSAIPAAGTISDAKQILVLKDGSGVSVQVLSTTGVLKQTNTTSAFTTVTGASSLVWLDKLKISSTDYVLGYNSADNKIYGKAASASSMSGFSTTLSPGTSVISHLSVHGSQLTLAGSNGGIFTSDAISAVPSSINFYKREDHRLIALNSIRKLASKILITGDNGLLISRNISTSASTGSVKPLETLNNLYAVNEFEASSVNYYLIGGSNSYFSQLEASNFQKTNLYTTSGLTVTNHAQGVSFRDIAVKDEAVYVVGDNGTVYYTSSIISEFFLPAPHISTTHYKSVAFNSSNMAVVVGNKAEMVRYSAHIGTLNNHIFSPKYRDVHFTSPQSGTIVGDHFFVRTTNDGGQSWKINLPGSLLNLTSYSNTLRKVWTLPGSNSNHGCILGFYDNYLSLVNNGTFSLTAVPGQVSDLQFSANSPLNGYFSYNSSTSAIRRLTVAQGPGGIYSMITSTDLVAGSYSINALHVFDNQSVIYTGTNGNINYFNHSNSTNYLLATISGASFNDIYFHDNVVGYVAGDNGVWYNLNSVNNDNVTHDILSGGLTWSIQPINDPEIGSATDYHITAIAFNTRTTGVYGGKYTSSAYLLFKKSMVRNVKHEGGLYTARFYYDRLGRIVTSQNSRQLAEKKFSYTLYDALGRVYEAGEKTENDPADPQFASIFGTNVGGVMVPSVIDDAKLTTWLDNDATSTRKEVTRSYYDVTNAGIEPALPILLTEATQRKRIVHVTYEAVYDGLDEVYDHATHYDYDIHGNVKTLLQENQLLGAMANLNQHRFKRMDYTYDLISGNVHRVDYETGNADQWHHAYNYDADNRITEVYTTKETPLMDIHSSVASLQNEPEISPLWDQEASYEYYAHGPLARTTLGENKVQGIDYVYTLQGWIKGVNSNGLNQDKDPGRDGNGVSNHQDVARDVFGYSLHYFDGDYSPIVSGNNEFLANQASSDLVTNSSDLYNGNIGRMVTTITDPNTRQVLPLGNAYKYDQLNRLKESRSFDNYNASTNSWGSGGTTRYYNAFAYDANGNIETQERQNHVGMTIDKLTYNYHDAGGKRLRNRLYGVNDTVSNGTFPDDIDDMIFDANQATIASNNNYVYDAEGRLVKDLQEEIDTIIWRVDGKVKEIIRTPLSEKKNVSFDYDAMGHRIAKHILTQEGVLEKSTYYVLDAQGNAMSVYDRVVNSEAESVAFAQAEKHIYGSSRLGMHDQRVAMLGSQNNSYTMGTVDHRTGHRLYELNNHLGNVLSVVSDKLMASTEDIITVVDFDDRFDTDGDFLSWDNYNWAVDTHFIDNGRYTIVGGGYALKYWPLITAPITFYNGDWLTTYTFTFDIIYMSPGGQVNIGTDGVANQNFYTTGPQTWSFLYSPYSGAGMDITFTGDSLIMDNIKLVHDTPPYIYQKADIRQSTDYSPFGVMLENRNLKKSVVVSQNCSTITEYDTTYALNFGSDSSKWYNYGTRIVARWPNLDIFDTLYLNSNLPDTVFKQSSPSSTLLDTLIYPAIKHYRIDLAVENGNTYHTTFDFDAGNCLISPFHIDMVLYGDTIPLTSSGSYSFINTIDSLKSNGKRLRFIVYGDTSLCQALITNLQVYSLDSIGFEEHCDTIWRDWDYRYGFQNQEMDDEIKGPGNSVNYTYRMHDPRLGRFFAVDPLAKRFPYYSTYQFSGNCVIAFIELEGNEPGIIFPSTVEFNTLKTNEQTITQNWRAIQAHNWADMAAELKKLKASDVNIKIEYVYIQTHGSSSGLVIGPKLSATEEDKAKFKVTDNYGIQLTDFDLKEYAIVQRKGGLDKYKRFASTSTFNETDHKGNVTQRKYSDWADNEGASLNQFFEVLSELPDNTTVIFGACTFGNTESALTKLYEMTGKRLNFVANKSVTSPPGGNLLDTDITSCGIEQGWVKIGSETGGKVMNITGTAQEGFIRLNSTGEKPMSYSTENKPCAE